jgi:hypothetical protein
MSSTFTFCIAELCRDSSNNRYLADRVQQILAHDQTLAAFHHLAAESAILMQAAEQIQRIDGFEIVSCQQIAYFCVLKLIDVRIVPAKVLEIDQGRVSICP